MCRGQVFETIRSIKLKLTHRLPLCDKTKSQLALSRRVVRFGSSSVLWIKTDVWIRTVTCPRATAAESIKERHLGNMVWSEAAASMKNREAGAGRGCMDISTGHAAIDLPWSHL